MHYERLASLIFDTALPGGARHVDDLLTTWEWDVGSHCDEPFARTLHARRDYYAEKGYRVCPGSLTLHLSGLPCRHWVPRTARHFSHLRQIGRAHV